MGFSEGVRTHFSVVLPDGNVAVQPHDLPWSLVRAEDLVLFSLDNDKEMAPSSIGPSAFEVHRSMHRQLGARASCIIHVHSPYAAILSTLQPPTLEMVHQNCAYFYKKILFLSEYEGTDGNGTVLQRTIDALRADDNLRVAVLANHGVTFIAESVAEAFDDLFYFENAARIFIEGLKTGRRQRHIPADVCTRVAAHRDRDRKEYSLRHFNTLKLAHSAQNKL